MAAVVDEEAATMTVPSGVLTSMGERRGERLLPLWLLLLRRQLLLLPLP